MKETRYVPLENFMTLLDYFTVVYFSSECFVEKNEILPLSERSRVAAAKNVVYGGSDEKEMTGKKKK